VRNIENFNSYSKILEEIQTRNPDWDWEQMNNADRAIVKAFVIQVIKDFEDYAQKIEQWENYYGKVENDIVLH